MLFALVAKCQMSSDGTGSAIFGLGMGLENFPLKSQNISIFPPLAQKNLFGLGQKVPGSKVGRPLIYCGPKVCFLLLVDKVMQNFYNFFNPLVVENSTS